MDSGSAYHNNDNVFIGRGKGMTTHPNLKVGERINVCVSIADFCGIYQNGLIFNSNDISFSSNPCLVNSVSPGCMRIDGIGIRARFARVSGSAECTACTPVQNYTELGTMWTNSSGTATLQYMMTEKDLADYQNCIAAGDLYKLVTCIVDSLGQSIIKKGVCSEILSVSSASQPPVEMHGDYVVTLNYFEMPYARNSAEKIANAVATIWNNNASRLTGWNFKSVTVNTTLKEITLIITKTGSTEFVVAWGIILAIFILNPELALLLVGLGLIGFFINRINIQYVVQPAYKEGYVVGFEEGKTISMAVVSADPNLSPEDKTRINTAINGITPDPNDIEREWQDYAEKTFGIVVDAITIPTIAAPTFVLVDSEFEVKGVCDPNYNVVLYRDDQFSVWDIFRGDPFAFLDDSLKETTSDTVGNYSIKYTFVEQNGYRVYVKTGGKESKRAKIYVIAITTLLLLAVIIIIMYMIYMKKIKGRRK